MTTPPYYEVRIRTKTQMLVMKTHCLQDALDYYNEHAAGSIYARLLEHWIGYSRFIKFQSRSY